MKAKRTAKPWGMVYRRESRGKLTRYWWLIYQFPGVKEAAVVGLPDPRKGEQPVAFVTVAEGHSVDEKALLQFIRTKLADYKVPKNVVFMPALPRNATGKILKTALRQLKPGQG